MKHIILITLLLLTGSQYTVYSQIITTIAGGFANPISGDGGPATAAGILHGAQIAVDNTGNLYISGHGNYSSFPNPDKTASKVRKVNTSGTISTFAGIDTVGFSGDGGQATNARLATRGGIAFDKKGNVYIADMEINYRVRKVDTFGIITTFAGNGTVTVSGDGGPATAAGLGGGVGICSDAIGNIYIAAGSRIRKVDTAGIITTFAGGGPGSYSGDGGPATAAGMATQGQIAFDKYGNMYIADRSNQRVRKINTSGIITTIAGNGTWGYSGDGGQATAAQLKDPTGVFPDNCGNVYIADFTNNRLRVVNGSGIISTFAGNGSYASGGDGGQATAAQIQTPRCVYLDKHGNIYINDEGSGRRVRYIHMDSCRNTVGISAPGLTRGEEVLRIWPNPTNGQLTISNPDNTAISYTIKNLLGQTMINGNMKSGEQTVDISYFIPGNYFINFTKDGVPSGNKRFIKK